MISKLHDAVKLRLACCVWTRGIIRPLPVRLTRRLVVMLAALGGIPNLCHAQAFPPEPSSIPPVVQRAEQVRPREKISVRIPPEAPANLPPPPQLPEVETEIVKLRPQFMTAVDLAKALALAVGNQGSLAVLEEQDCVLVAGSPETLQRAIRMLEQVDTPRAQVRLSVYLFDVKVEDLQQLGLAAATQLKAQSIDAAGMPLNVNSSPSELDSERFHVLSTQLELSQVVKMLSESPGSKLLADPDMVVVDRQTASFNVVTRVPISTTANESRAAGDSAKFEEAGTKLSIIPRIASDTSIEMRVSPEYSTLAGFNSQGAPVIEVRRAETMVRVADRQTLVMGGLRRQMTVEAMQGIPGLMNWKVVGPLFRSTGTELMESELICIVRPEILPVAGSTAISQPLLSMPSTAEPVDTNSVVQSAGIQGPSTSEASQIKPSAYRPSTYNRTSQTNTPRRNITGSRNSVAQPSPWQRQR